MLKVDKKSCDQCASCISICPSDSLVLTDVLKINHQTCLRCGKCVKICPFGALTMEEENGRKS
jgi:Fe-S-cluster-containing hydrogenase component 2